MLLLREPSHSSIFAYLGESPFFTHVDGLHGHNDSYWTSIQLLFSNELATIDVPFVEIVITKVFPELLRLSCILLAGEAKNVDVATLMYEL